MEVENASTLFVLVFDCIMLLVGLVLNRSSHDTNNLEISRRDLISTTSKLGLVTTITFVRPKSAQAKCTNIDTCREIGEIRDEEIQKETPIVRLGQGLQYKVVNPGVGTETVPDIGTGAKVSIAYSISQGIGRYMYSRGFGYNKLDLGNGQVVPDIGSVDSFVVTLGGKDVPIGIQKALVGMKRGEKRVIECPASLGFETSNWNPQPTTFSGRQQIKDYQARLFGRGDTQPPFPAETIWTVEVLRIYQ